MKPLTRKPLTCKQQAFVTEYLKDFNATQACIRAGYKATNADVTGPTLLGNLRISFAIRCAQEKAASAAVAGLQEAQERVTAILRSDLAKASDVIAAADRLSKWSGWDKATKVEADVNLTDNRISLADIRPRLPSGGTA